MWREHRPALWAGPHAQWRTQRIGATRIHWVEDGAGPPLLLLHGYSGTARWWVRNIAALSSRRRVYALDLPGFGHSRLRETFTLVRVVDMLAEWMEALELPAADVVGHSMGGQIALLLAARYPTRVRSMVLAAPAGVPFDTGLLGIGWRAFRSRRTGDFQFTPLVVAGVLHAGPRALWQAVAQIRALDIRLHLAAIKVPTLILWGDRDELLAPENGPILAGALANAELRIIQGAGHTFMFDQPHDFNTEVLEFLARIAKDAAR